MTDSAYAAKRKRRVKRLKTMIVASFFLMLTVPLALCIWLGCKLYITNNELSEMTAQYESQLSIIDELQAQLESIRLRDSKEAEGQISMSSDGTEAEGDSAIDGPEEQIHKVYLTFDDGPSIYTEQILDVLDEYGVKATFFVTGAEADSNPERYQEIVSRGHTLGMHSYSHVYNDVYRSRSNFIKDFNKLKDYLTETTGVTPVIYRFPGGSSNTVSATDMGDLCDYLESQGVRYFDWNISSGDATNPSLSASRITANCINSIPNHMTAVILLHDTGSKRTTVEALPGIIEQILQMEDTVILPITEDTEAVRHRE